MNSKKAVVRSNTVSSAAPKTKSSARRPFATTKIDGEEVGIFWDVPEFNKRGFLPPGIHQENRWRVFDERFAWNVARKRLLKKLHHLACILGKAGCHALYVGGSYVTAKKTPGDFDVVWEIGYTRFDQMEPQDVLNLLHTAQNERPKIWGGHVWRRGEMVRDIWLPWSRRPYPENIPAVELLCHNRLAEPPLPVGIVQLDPWRLAMAGRSG